MAETSRPLIYLRVGLFALCMAAGIYLFYRMDFDVTKVFESRHHVSGWMFVLAMSLLPVVGFPIAAFYLFAGAAFGFWEGWFYCLVSLAINMSLSYFVARYCLHEALGKLLQKGGYTLPDLSEVNEFRFTFILRTVPGPPFPVQNYLLSLLGVRFPIYISISLLSQGAIAAGMVACGGALPESITMGHVLVGMALLSVLIGMKVLLTWRKKRQEAIRSI
ncbi:TVP38/TMEM64 family protein [Coraliomargarita sp. W4R53]